MMIDYAQRMWSEMTAEDRCEEIAWRRTASSSDMAFADALRDYWYTEKDDAEQHSREMSRLVSRQGA